MLKVKGNTFYITHLDVSQNIGFSTKETPDNPHTKAALKFTGRIMIKEVVGKGGVKEIVALIYI